MESKISFKDKLENVLFLQVSIEKLSSIFNIDIKENVYMPIKAEKIVDNVKLGDDMEKIPLAYFIEAMYFVLGADEDFKFNYVYKRMLENVLESVEFVKGKIFKLVDSKNYEDAYIMIKGLVQVEENEDNFSKMLMLSDKLRTLDKAYKNEELKVVYKAKSVLPNFPLPYLYECLIKKDEGDYQIALIALNEYISKAGKETKDITELKISLENIVNYEKGRGLVYDNPKEALMYLLPLLSEFKEDVFIYYHIAIAYRILENFEKAIYYLNEAISLDSNMPELVNELGINHACIGDYNKAIAYLRKAFEATKSIEICTNLVMCYLNAGKIKEAKLHLEIAKKLDPKDEVVIEIEEFLKKQN